MNEVSRYEKMVTDSKSERIPRSKAIRYKCLDCCCYQPNEVRECTVTDCPLWRYRMGYEQRDDLYYQYKNKIEKE